MARTFVSFVSVVSLVSVGLAGAPGVAQAQIADSIGIRAQGMGGAFTAVADDATAAWWNPAGLAGGAFVNAILEGGNDHHAGVSIAYPALGLSYYRLRVSQIQAPTSTDTSSASRQDPGTADVHLRSIDVSQFGATVGQSLGRHLVVGSTARVVRGAGSTRGDLDLGVMAALGPARLAVTARHLPEPTLGDGPESLRLGRQVRAGLALTSAARGAVAVTVAVDADLTKVAGPTGNERRLAAGAELWTPSRRFGGRAGLSWSTFGGRGRAGSLGASVAIRSGTYFDVQLSHIGENGSQRSAGAAVRVTF